MPTLSLQPYLIALSVANVDQAAAWYQQHLGFEPYRRMDLPDYGLRIIFLKHNDFRLELVEKQHSFSVKDRLPDLADEVFVRGFKKLAFRVPDVEALAARLKAAGVTFRFELSESTQDPDERTKWCMIEDPDGNCIQFFQPLRS